MANTGVTRLPKYVTTHTKRKAVGWFPNPMLDPVRFHTFWDDFDRAQAGNVTSGVFVSGWYEQGTGTGGAAGLDPTIASSMTMISGGTNGDMSLLGCIPSNASQYACFQTGALSDTKKIIMGIRFTVDVDTCIVQAGLMPVATTDADSTPAGATFYKPASAAPTFVAGAGTTNALSGTYSSALTVSTMTELWFYYNGAGEAFGWQDNNLSFHATGVAPSTWDTGAKAVVMGIKTSSGAAKQLWVDYLCVALER